MKELKEITSYWKLRREALLYIMWWYQGRLHPFRFRAGPVPRIHARRGGCSHHQHHRPQLREYFATKTPKKREEIWGVNFDPVRCDKAGINPWDHERDYGVQKTWKAYRETQYHRPEAIDRHIHAPAYWDQASLSW